MLIYKRLIIALILKLNVSSGIYTIFETIYLGHVRKSLVSAKNEQTFSLIECFSEKPFNKSTKNLGIIEWGLERFKYHHIFC